MPSLFMEGGDLCSRATTRPLLVRDCRRKNSGVGCKDFEQHARQEDQLDQQGGREDAAQSRSKPLGESRTLRQRDVVDSGVAGVHMDSGFWVPGRLYQRSRGGV